jgi:predicted enzyme related to lactoylglutathione lyase
MQAPDGELEMWAFPAMMGDGPGAAGALVKMDGFDAGVGGTLVYLACQDCAVQAERAGANGGSVVKPKFSIGPYGFCALVTDTEGNMIGLHSLT